MEQEIRQMLRDLGCTPWLRGYDYLTAAVLLMHRHGRQPLLHATYPAIAAQYGTSVSAVERSIRWAIQVMATSRHAEEFRRVVGPVATPSNVIFALADHIRLNYTTTAANLTASEYVPH